MLSTVMSTTGLSSPGADGHGAGEDVLPNANRLGVTTGKTAQADRAFRRDIGLREADFVGRGIRGRNKAGLGDAEKR